MTARGVSDDELHALVDGQLAADRIDDALAWLRAHPDDAIRVAQWQAQRAQLRRLHRSTDPGTTPDAMVRLVRRRRPAWRQAAAALLLVAAGIAGGRLWPVDAPAPQDRQADADAPRFVRDAAIAHAVYAPEKRHPVEVTADDEAHLVQWLGRRLNAPLRAPVLQAHGFRLLGGRLLPGPGTPRAQFMYEDAAGRRTTLYVTVFDPAQAPVETAFRAARDGTVASFYWVEGRFGYALSGDLPPSEVMALARVVHAQLSR
jgi:anti-sigma factor RsiW